MGFVNHHAAWIALLGVGLLATLRACSSERDEDGAGVASDSGADGEASDDVQTDVTQKDVVSEAVIEAGPCPPSATPADVPAGWIKYPIFGCKYPIYRPPNHAALPSGISWEECTDLGPDPYTCRQLVVDWPNSEKPLGGIPTAHVTPDGRVLLQLRKLQTFYEPSGKAFSLMALVLEADGPVHQAFWISKLPVEATTFTLSMGGLSASRSTWYAVEFLTTPSAREATLGGAVDLLEPPVLADYPEGDPDGGLALPGETFYALRGSGLQIRRWDGESFGKVYQGLDVGSVTWIGSSAIWDPNTIELLQIWAWTEEKGAVPLISFGNSDFTRGVSNAVTDGKDLVWLQGEERDISVSEIFPKRSVMTSKFTTDPSLIQAKRLRSWEAPSIWTTSRPNAIGCGYAALESVPADLDYRVVIVRLSDGVSWTLKSPADRHWTWGKPVAVTCDEVFVTWGKDGASNLRRVRLNSLGPGSPPD
jgi:hypothetical protein